MSAAFDTLAYARRMESVGFTRAQAEAMAEEQAKLIDERLATKADMAAIGQQIEQLRGETRADIERLREETRADIERLREETRADIERLREETRADIERLREETRAEGGRLREEARANTDRTRDDIRVSGELLRRDLVIRLGSIVVAAVAVGSTLVTLLSRLHP